MAAVARYIYSHYDPPSEPTAEKLPEENLDDESDPWQTESAFGAQSRVANAPHFVRAVVSYDEINDMIGCPQEAPLEAAVEDKRQDVAGWYRSLRRGNSASISTTPSGASTPTSPKQPMPVEKNPELQAAETKERVTKNNWFIRKALQDESVSASTMPLPSLADILAREPPASSKKDAVRPPVFLTLGPSNRGFAMLEKSGWSEGEVLGSHAIRRNPVLGGFDMGKKTEGLDKEVRVKEEEWEVPCDADGEVSEVRTVEVVDLTLSDSGEEEGEEDAEADLGFVQSISTSASNETMDHSGTALVTPLPIVLKSDRLGIGLKAKTEGPYRASRKRVTPNQAALAAHIQSNEEMKRKKKLFGRGRLAFARAAKLDSEQRRQLLAGLNDS